MSVSEEEIFHESRKAQYQDGQDEEPKEAHAPRHPAYVIHHHFCFVLFACS